MWELVKEVRPIDFFTASSCREAIFFLTLPPVVKCDSYLQIKSSFGPVCSDRDNSTWFVSHRNRRESMSRLFESSDINGMKLANRFVRSATWEGMASPPWRLPIMRGSVRENYWPMQRNSHHSGMRHGCVRQCS